MVNGSKELMVFSIYHFLFTIYLGSPFTIFYSLYLFQAHLNARIIRVHFGVLPQQFFRFL